LACLLQKRTKNSGGHQCRGYATSFGRFVCSPHVSYAPQSHADYFHGRLKGLETAKPIKKVDFSRQNAIIGQPVEKTGRPWGYLTSVDLYGCDGHTIRSEEKIRKFVIELCDLIEMKRFGETQIVHFGQDKRVEGYSMVQLIETSMISAHFANQTNTAYLDIFSCKSYDPDTVVRFSESFFNAERTISHVIQRM